MARLRGGDGGRLSGRHIRRPGAVAELLPETDDTGQRTSGALGIAHADVPVVRCHEGGQEREGMAGRNRVAALPRGRHPAGLRHGAAVVQDAGDPREVSHHPPAPAAIQGHRRTGRLQVQEFHHRHEGYPHERPIPPAGRTAEVRGTDRELGVAAEVAAGAVQPADAPLPGFTHRAARLYRAVGNAHRGVDRD